MGSSKKINDQYNGVSHAVFETFDWIGNLVWAFVVGVFIFTALLMSFTVHNISMLPTLREGDQLWVNRLVHKPTTGDIVTIATSEYLENGQEFNLVKRVIASEGQTFSIDYDNTHNVYVDGKLLNEPYINEPTALKPNWNIPGKVPEGSLMVMGDNRNHSADSRDRRYKFIKYDQIYGKAVVCYWPLNRIKIL